MPSSISSSNPSPADSPVMRQRGRWAIVWTLALSVAIVIVASVELYWRGLGYRPNIRDSSELWSIQRDRVYATKKVPLVMLGASRIEFAIDMKLIKQLLPQYQPVMLAQNAHYPFAVLRDLADDERFHGVVLCDIDTNGLFKVFADSQQPLVDYYHRQWSPSWHLHRWLLNAWQAHFDVANPDLEAITAARRWLDGSTLPQREYFTFYRDRSGDIDYTRTDPEAAKRHFADLVANSKDLHALAAPDVWLSDLRDVYRWVAQINARGGRVIFYQSPTSGTVAQIDARIYPRDLYWDRFAASVPATTLNAADVPALEAFRLPDDSHLDYRDKPAYTRALVDALVAQGALPR